jgi:hypothetical protein
MGDVAHRGGGRAQMPVVLLPGLDHVPPGRVQAVGNGRGVGEAIVPLRAENKQTTRFQQTGQVGPPIRGWFAQGAKIEDKQWVWCR